MTDVNVSDLARNARIARWVALAGYLLLLLGLTLSTLVWPSRGRDPNVVIWLIVTVPLLIFLPGLWRARPRTHAWLCFVTLLYFLMAVPNVFIADGRELAVVELVGVVMLFLGSMFYVRWAARGGAGGATQLPG